MTFHYKVVTEAEIKLTDIISMRYPTDAHLLAVATALQMGILSDAAADEVSCFVPATEYGYSEEYPPMGTQLVILRTESEAPGNKGKYF